MSGYTWTEQANNGFQSWLCFHGKYTAAIWKLTANNMPIFKWDVSDLRYTYAISHASTLETAKEMSQAQSSIWRAERELTSDSPAVICRLHTIARRH